ncbi:MAG: hypothetical protein R6V85_14060 [Polyangia bacterium]
MDYRLTCEGFPPDDELREQLLLRGRSVVLHTGGHSPVRLSVKQVEGRVQGRVEVILPDRRLSAVVWRAEPLAAIEDAAAALLDVLGEDWIPPIDEEEDRGVYDSGEVLSTLQ